MTTSDKSLKTKKETATFLSVSERTVDRWLLDGTLPANVKVIIGGSVRFRHDVLLNHIEAMAGDNGDNDAAKGDSK